jgi:hypothetical protein
MVSRAFSPKVIVTVTWRAACHLRRSNRTATTNRSSIIAIVSRLSFSPIVLIIIIIQSRLS